MLNSDYARLRILEAAYDLFGKCGYAATTVRMIAQQADVSLSAIPYYFESKDNLFRQVVEGSVREFAQYFEPTLQEINGFLARPQHETETAKALLLKLANKHLDYVLDPKNDKQMRLFFQLRSSFDSPVMQDSPFSMSTIPPLVALFQILRPELAQEDATILAYSIIGEQLFFFYHRPSVLAQLHIQEYGPAAKKRIRTVLMQKLEQELDA
ncbi:MAG: TetR family transcriptional regulator [Candidatus Avoscillospira sp.]